MSFSHTHPKLCDNFQISTSFDSKNALASNIITAERPKFSIVDGKRKPSPLKIVFRDDDLNEVSKILEKQIESQCINHWSSFDLEIKTFFRNFVANPHILESFKLSECRISEIEYSNFDFNIQKPMSISVTITFEASVHYLK